MCAPSAGCERASATTRRAPCVTGAMTQTGRPSTRSGSNPVLSAWLICSSASGQFVTRNAFQRFERKPQRGRERDHIGILGECARRYQNAFGADVEFQGTRFGGRKRPRGKPMPQAVEFGTGRERAPRRVAVDTVVRAREPHRGAVVRHRPARDTSALLAPDATQRP